MSIFSNFLEGEDPFNPLIENAAIAEQLMLPKKKLSEQNV